MNTASSVRQTYTVEEVAEILGSIRVSQRHFGAFRGFSWGFDWKGPVGARGKRTAFSQGTVGAFCASTAPSASTGPVRARQDGSQGGGHA